MRTGITGVAGWHKNSFVDFPGTVSAVLFFSGCNLACPYCHNPDIVNAASSSFVDPGDIADFLAKRKGLIDGVVLSGGEPTLHAGLADAASRIRSLGYLVKLDTNGLLPDAAEAVKPDYLALDVKTAPRLYPMLLASPYSDTAHRIARSVDMARAMGERSEVRITLAPGIVDREVIREIGELVNGVKRAFLQPMRVKGRLLDSSMADREPIPDSEIAAYRDIMAEFVSECAIRA
jgi:pyruvate formate lyase activating enzyme